MAANTSDRFRGASDFAEALGALAGGSAVPAPRGTLQETRAETAAGVGVGAAAVVAEEPRSAGPLLTGIGLTRNAGIPDGKRGGVVVGILLAAAATVALAAFVLTRGGGGDAGASSTQVPPPPVDTTMPMGIPAPPPPSPAHSTGWTEVSAPSVPSGQSAVSGHPTPTPPLPAPRKNAPQPSGAPLAVEPAPAPAPVQTAAKPAATPDCSQTYVIDSDGNKHFRPECYPHK
jgi:hypothetical protein